MWHGILWWQLVHNWHLRINSALDSRGMVHLKLSFPIVASVICLSSTGLASTIHYLHLNVSQKIEFVPTSERHTARGSLLDNYSILGPGPDIRTLVLTRLSANRLFPGHTVRNSWGFQARALMNSHFHIEFFTLVATKRTPGPLFTPGVYHFIQSLLGPISKPPIFSM